MEFAVSVLLDSIAGVTGIITVGNLIFSIFRDRKSLSTVKEKYTSFNTKTLNENIAFYSETKLAYESLSKLEPYVEKLLQKQYWQDLAKVGLFLLALYSITILFSRLATTTKEANDGILKAFLFLPVLFFAANKYFDDTRARRLLDRFSDISGLLDQLDKVKEPYNRYFLLQEEKQFLSSYFYALEKTERVEAKYWSGQLSKAIKVINVGLVSSDSK